MDQERLADGGADPHARVEGRCTGPGTRSGTAAAACAARARVQRQQVGALEMDRPRVGLDQADEQRARASIFPDPDSPTSPTVSPGLDVEVHAVDGAAPAEPDGRRDRDAERTSCAGRGPRTSAAHVELRTTAGGCRQHETRRAGRDAVSAGLVAGARARTDRGSAGGSGSPEGGARGRAPCPAGRAAGGPAAVAAGNERSSPCVYGWSGAAEQVGDRRLLDEPTGVHDSRRGPRSRPRHRDRA